jgi:hypothetical protein
MVKSILVMACAGLALSAQPRPSGRTEFSGMMLNRGSEKCADVNGASTAPEANVQQWSCADQANQRWEFIAVGNHEYAVRSVKSGMVLDVANGSRDNGANVQQYPWNNGANQRWRGEGSNDNFLLTNVGSGKCLDVADGSRADGANVIQYDCHGRANQRWHLGYQMNSGGRPGVMPPQGGGTASGVGTETAFSVRRSSGWDDRRRDGECTIRVRVDDQVDVILRGDRIRIRTLRGAPGQDVGSECDGPLPNGVSQVQFTGLDGRGDVRLVEQPNSRNGWAAVVSIHDPRGGEEGYAYRISWRATRPYSNSGYNSNWDKHDSDQQFSLLTPSWAVGSWVGYNNNNPMDLEIASDGRAMGTTPKERIEGTWRDGRLHFGSSSWIVNRKGSEMQLVLANDSRNVMRFRRR